MKRRDFIKQAGVGAVATSAAVAPAIVSADTKIKWKMVTTWPKNFPVLGTGANQLAELITEMSDGRIKVKVYGGGELVPAFEVFDAVSRGTAQLGHGAAYCLLYTSDAADESSRGWFSVGGVSVK